MCGSSFATASGTVLSSALMRASNSVTSSVSRSIVCGFRCSVASRANSSKRARSSMTLLRLGTNPRQDATRGKAAASGEPSVRRCEWRGILPAVLPYDSRPDGRFAVARASACRYAAAASHVPPHPSRSRAMPTTPSHATHDTALEGFTLAAGFHTAATACGLKPSGNLDLGLVWSDAPCSAAGVFTTNRVQAAPVVLDRDTLAAAAGHVRAVLYNSGCANAVTGERGFADAKRMRALGATAVGALEEEVLVRSTGVIGRFLDMEKLERGVAALRSPSALRAPGDAARAIMTTDTRVKIASVEIQIGRAH